MTDLKPCPFCAATCEADIEGDEDTGYAVYITADHLKWCPFAESEQTGAINGLSLEYDTDEEMLAFIANWNRRPEPPPLVSQDGEGFEGWWRRYCESSGNTSQATFYTVAEAAWNARATPQAAPPDPRPTEIHEFPNGAKLHFYAHGDKTNAFEGAEAPAPSVREARQKLVDLKDRITERLFQSFEATNAEEILEWLEEAFPLLAASPSQSSSPPSREEAVSVKSRYSVWLEQMGYHDTPDVEMAYRAGYAQGKHLASPPAPGVGEALSVTRKQILDICWGSQVESNPGKLVQGYLRIAKLLGSLAPTVREGENNE